MKRELSRDGRSHFRRGNEKSITLIVNVLTVLIAAVFLISPIVTFYFLQEDSVKLAMIAVLTIAFAISIALIMNARRAEIFAATAAYVMTHKTYMFLKTVAGIITYGDANNPRRYAAVLVVFVSNGPSSLNK